MTVKTTTAIALSFLLCAFLFTSTVLTSNGIESTPSVYTAVIHNIITNGTTEYIDRAVQVAETNNAEALILRIDTPGGIVGSTLGILETIMASEVPIITYVEPQGAIAASAGSFILISGHIAAMAPGTTCGAAMPVTISMTEEGAGTETADEKTINFLAGHVRSIADERHHNGPVAEKFVTENLTLTSAEALDEGIIDLTAPNFDELLKALDGMSVTVQGNTRQLNTRQADLVAIELTSKETATGIISNPMVSFLLVIMGIYGLVIGFNAPHTYIPESAGAIALVIGLYGLGMFNMNIFAGLMLILGVLLLIAEAMTPTYGVLSVAGIVSMVVGGFFLPQEPLMPRSWWIAFRSVSIGVAIGASILMLIVVKGILRIRRKKTVQGPLEFLGLTGIVTEVTEDGCLVRINGEIWQGKTENDELPRLNQEVTVLRREGIAVVISSKTKIE